MTISLPDELAAALDREARRRRVPASQVAREALEARLGRGAGRRELPFKAIGRSGQRTTARTSRRSWPIAVLADRLGTDLIVTLDRRHFGVIRSKLGSAFRLLPD